MPFVTRPDGCRISYEVHGAPDARALLLMEGMGGDLPGWRRNIPTLARELRVIAYDHRGNGLSDEPPGPCTMATFVDDAVGLLDHLGVERAHVYGQSFGGMVALELALTHADRARALVLACTHAGNAHAVRVDEGTVPKGEPWRALYAPGFPDAHPEHVADDLRAGSATPPHPTGQRRQWEAVQTWDAFDRLPSLRVPTMILHGTEDRMIAPANARTLAERIPDAELVWIQGAGHVYHSERAEESDAAVLSFLGGHSDA